MRRPPALLSVLLVLGVLGFVATSAGARDRRRRPGSPLHPPVLLQDAQGESVVATGRPVSPEVTCGECHDTSYIESHSYHAAAGFDELRAPGEVPGGAPWEISGGLFGRWDPVRYRRLTLAGESTFDLGVADWIRVYGDRHVGGGPAYWGRDGEPLALSRPGTEPAPETHVQGVGDEGPRVWDWAASGAVEMNCFLCHLSDPANEARVEALRTGAFEWAATATLARTGRAVGDGSPAPSTRTASWRAACWRSGIPEARTAACATTRCTWVGSRSGSACWSAGPMPRGMARCSPDRPCPSRR